jgi:hypothetical protein
VLQIDLDFSILYPDAGDLLSSFVPEVVEPLLQYVSLHGNASIKAVAASCQHVSTGLTFVLFIFN